MLLTKEIKNLLTKTITDPYGRKIGKIIAFSIDFKENIEFVGIELSNGDFSYYPASQITVKNESVLLNNPWHESIRLAEEYTLILRKNSTLNELYNSREIQQEIYEEIRKQYESTIKDITERCKILSDDQKKRIDILNIQIKELKTFLTKMKIEYSLDNKDDEKYNVSLLNLQTILNRALSEKKDIEVALNNIPKNPTLIQTTPNEPPKITTKEQPIVLRIKEAES